jgi:hypothetical protein
MRSDFKNIFLIATHGVAIAGVFFAVKSWSGNNPFAAMAFGTMAGATILGLIAWWNFMKAEPIRQRWLGNFLYEGACTCSVILAVVGVVLAWGFYDGNNPYWELISPFMIVAFWSNALICWIIGRAFLYFLAGR